MAVPVVPSQGGSLKVRRRLGAVLAACTIGITVAFAPASAHADTAPTWAIAPAVTATSPNARAMFDVVVGAGQPLQDVVVLANLSDQPLTFDLYAADARSTSTGAFSLLLRNQPRHDVGEWITLPTDSLTVPPHAAANIPFTMRVPRGATPGDHAGGIVALSREGSPGQAGGVSVNVRRGSGVRLYVRVPGKVRNGLAVTDIRHRTSVGLLGSGHSSISFDVRNTGNARLDATASAKAVDLFGRTVKRFPATRLPALLPGSTATVNQAWKHLPRFGRFRIVVEVHATGASAGGRSVFWVMPWLLVVLLAFAIALAIWRRRRSRRSDDPDVAHAWTHSSRRLVRTG